MRRLFAGAAAIVLAVAMTGVVDAAPRKRGAEGGEGTVRACSIYGNGCTSAPVRRGATGEEFRLPGGTWVSCRLDCKTALREETVDFWETQRERAGDSLM